MSLDAIFKAYDIRGVYPDEIDEAIARRVGNAFARFTGAPRILVARDMRPSSIPLSAAFAEGVTLAGADVTDQYADLEARLHSSIALRDRLQQLLTRAGTLDDVLKLEKEIARLQSDIDALQARIDQLKSRTELASLAVSLEHKHVLGPVAVVGRGFVRLASKLFVIR